MKPSIPGGLMSMAVLLYEVKRYEEAIPKFTEVIANDTTELAGAYYYRADSYYNIGDKDNACLDWSRACAWATRMRPSSSGTIATRTPKRSQEAEAVAAEDDHRVLRLLQECLPHVLPWEGSHFPSQTFPTRRAVPRKARVPA